MLLYRAGQADAEQFQGHPHFDHVRQRDVAQRDVQAQHAAERGRVHRTDGGAPGGAGADGRVQHALGLEGSDRFTHAGASDAQLGGELPFGRESVTHPEVAGQHLHLEPGQHHLVGPGSRGDQVRGGRGASAHGENHVTRRGPPKVTDWSYLLPGGCGAPYGVAHTTWSDQPPDPPPRERRPP
ncbi:hypothetical protein BJF82_07385 [Kytococcus sp. CUA-901]|nr:hypothetical protein BJF82_07385 [Kytococcus sp. CUA-901]